MSEKTEGNTAGRRLPRDGALVISTELPCHNCRIISERAAFRPYFAE